MDLLASVARAWGWCGIVPDLIVGDNAFGNLILKDKVGHYWRIKPEDLACSVVAESREALDALSIDQDFVDDWNMVELVQEAKSKVGLLKPGYKYCLKIPGALGGSYGGDNLAQIPHRELIEVSGSIAEQIRNVPDRARVELKVV